MIAAVTAAAKSVSDANIHALPVGHAFDGYRVLALLGAGGFGITYLAEEIAIGRKVAIKEYLPQGYAARAADSVSIRPVSAQAREQFSWGLDRFRKEAATLVNFEHPNIVAVHRYFEANGTAYLVMQYVEGKPLDVLLAGGNTLSESEIEEVIGPILDGLEQVHAAHFLHRDIKPANIYIRKDGRPVLLDFGAARQAFGTETKSITAIVSEGYAPFEQYEARGDQGPWSDIYAVGAVIYRCVSGERPPAAPERISAKLRNAPDPMLPARDVGAGHYSAALLDAADRALAPLPDGRPKDVAALRALLAAAATAPAASEPVSAATSGANPTLIATAPRRRRRVGIAAGIVAALAAGSAGAYFTLAPGGQAASERLAGPASPPVATADTGTPPAKAPPAASGADDAKRRAEEERRRADAARKEQAAKDRAAKEQARREAERQKQVDEAEAEARFAAQRLEQARTAYDKDRLAEARRLADDVAAILKPALAAAPRSLLVAAVQRDLAAFRQSLAKRIGERLAALLRDARSSTDAGKFDEAARTLDAAADLAPESPDVKAARQALDAARARAEAARKAEAARRAEDARKADEARKAEEARRQRDAAARKLQEDERRRKQAEEKRRAGLGRPAAAPPDRAAPAGGLAFAGRVGTLSRISAERRAVLRIHLRFGAGGGLGVSCTAEAADGSQGACFGAASGGGRWSSSGSTLCLSSAVINLPATTCYRVSSSGAQYTLAGPGLLAGGMFLQ